MNAVEIERIERLTRVRAIGAIVLSTILTATQGQRMDSGGGGLTAWLVWGGIVALFVVWASGLFRPRSFRLLLNDETSDLHRRRAIAIGFWCMLATAAVCFGLTYMKDYGPRDAIQVIVTMGISASLLSFGVWELSALAPRR